LSACSDLPTDVGSIELPIISTAALEYQGGQGFTLAVAPGAPSFSSVTSMRGEIVVGQAYDPSVGRYRAATWGIAPLLQPQFLVVPAAAIHSGATGVSSAGLVGGWVSFDSSPCGGVGGTRCPVWW